MATNGGSLKSTRLKPNLDVSANLIVHESMGTDLKGYYGYFPCKIEACCLCYIIKGNLKAIINIGEYEIMAGDFVVLLPGSFLTINEMSDDILLSFEGYSSAFLKKINFWKVISPIMQYVIKQPVFSLDERMGTFYRESFSIMTRVSRYDPSFLTHSIAKSALIVALLQRDKQDHWHDSSASYHEPHHHGCQGATAQHRGSSAGNISNTGVFVSHHL